jgi:hypothetical protein
VPAYGALCRLAIPAAFVASVLGCGGGGGGDGTATNETASTQTYRVAGTVTGLSAGTELTLLDDGGDSLTVRANGDFQFASSLSHGANYSVSIETQPSGQSCGVTHGGGTIGASDVTSIVVACAALPAIGPYIRQLVQYNAYPGANSTSWNVTLNNVQAGSTLYVVAIWPNFVNNYPTMHVADGSNLYTLLNRYDDTTRFNLGIQGTESMGHWYAADVAPGSYTINLTPTPQTFEDWVGLVVIEVAGVTAAPLDGHTLRFQASVPPGVDTIDASVSNAGSSGLLIAVSFDDIDSTAPTSVLAGSAMSDAGPLWDFMRDGRPAARVAFSLISSSGQHAALFTTQEGGPQVPDYLTCAVILQ